MSKRYIIIIAFLLAVTGYAAEQDFVNEANKAYSDDKYEQAIELYNKAKAEKGESSNLYYNIANCYYRLGQVGEAVLYYERALKLNPGNDDARYNLKLVNEKNSLETDNGRTYFSDAIYNWICYHSSNSWALCAGVCFILFVVALLAYLFMDSVSIRKTGFFGGGILLIVSVLALVFAFITHDRSENTKYAIVTIPSVTLSTSPRLPKDKTEEAFLLKEGFKVEVLDSVEVDGQKWYDVKTDDENRAWIEESQITKV